MHLLIILLQQLLGMLPSKKVPQPEVVRSGNQAAGSASAGPEPDACARLRPAPDLARTSWMTPCVNVFWSIVFANPLATLWSMEQLNTVWCRRARLASPPMWAVCTSVARLAAAGFARSAPCWRAVSGHH